MSPVSASRTLKRLSALGLAALSLATAAPACDDGMGSPTGWVCPTDSPLTWDNFGSDFMSRYCTRCHGSFRTQSGVARSRGSIDAWAAAGPNATNTGMPESGTAPTADERQLLGEWLSCGAP